MYMVLYMRVPNGKDDGDDNSQLLENRKVPLLFPKGKDIIMGVRPACKKDLN